MWYVNVLSCYLDIDIPERGRKLTEETYKEAKEHLDIDIPERGRKLHPDRIYAYRLYI